MRWTELTLIPTALAMAAPVQWVACAGGPAKVKATTRSAISGLNGGMRDGRVLSRHSPAAPSEPNRSCQRQMTVLAFPVRRMISAVPCPAAVSRTILARQTCFCGLFRLATTAFNAARSVALSLIWVLSCIPQTRITASAGKSARESKSQVWSTRREAIAQRSLPVLPVRPVQPAPTDPSPSAREFRLLLNELAAAELRRMFCSDEGACVRVGESVDAREER